MMLFLDTKWADDFGRELVSLALVGRDTKHVFYAERSARYAVASAISFRRTFTEGRVKHFGRAACI
jgi:hypothetical protein